MTARTPSTQPSVAIVGMACRVPGAADLDEFWRLLMAGRDATGDPPPGRQVTRRAGYLDDIEWFDNDWFAISAREAAMMDPQQRLALEVSVEALDDAGIGYRTRGSDAAVVFGACGYDHGVTVLGGSEQDAPYAVTGAALSIIANRLSYALDLHGPSLVVDSACSSSLAAVDIALRLLADETVPFAIVGGVNLTLLPHTSDYLAESGFLAEDGRCKPFSAAADGYTRSDGCSVLVLQRTADARREGNRVYAEILGAAVGSDGRSNGLYAPNGRAQRETVRAAWSRAGLDPRGAGYLECHGTGTALGDAVEVGALAAVLGAGADTWIGSVKSNLGHLEAAAGVTGLIKTALSIHRGVIAPTIHVDTPNPLLKLAKRGLRVPTEPVDWTAAPEERLAGVSSFGFGGTNAHVVLRGYPRSAASRGDEPPVLIPVTGRDVADLQIQALALAQRLDSAGEFASSCRGGAVDDSAWTRIPETAGTELEMPGAIGRFGESPATAQPIPRTSGAVAAAALDQGNSPDLLAQCGVDGIVTTEQPARATTPGRAARPAATEHTAHTRATGQPTPGTAIGQPAHATAIEQAGHATATRPTATGSAAHATATGPTGHATATEHTARATATGQVERATTTGQTGRARATEQGMHATATEHIAHARATGQPTPGTAIGQPAHTAATGQPARPAATDQTSQATATEQAATDRTAHAIATGQPTHATATGQAARPAATDQTSQATATEQAGHAAATSPTGHATATEYTARATATGQVERATTTGQTGRARATDQGMHATATEHTARTTATGQVERATTTGQTARATATEQGMHATATEHTARTTTSEKAATANEQTARTTATGWCRCSATAIAETATPERNRVGESAANTGGEGTTATGHSTESPALRPLAAAASRLLPEDARASVIAHDRAEAVAGLRALARGERGPAITGPGTVRRRGGVLFLFSGQGGQHARMGRALAARYPVFARALAEVTDAIVAHGGPKVWTPRYGFGLGEDGRAATELVQPAIFAYQVASAKLLASWGIRPDAVAGHSLGEIAAATVSGALTLDDAALVAVRRSRALATLDGQGAMALLEATPDETARLVAPVRAEVAIAAVNGPRSVVVSGTPRYIDTVVRRAKRRGMFAQRIAVDFAAHSPQVTSVLPEFISGLGDLAPRPPHTPVYSTTRRGAVLTTAALDGDYWAENASGTVELAAALERAAADGLATVLEIAPHSVLAPAAREYPEFRDATHPIADRDDEAGAFLRCLAGLYEEGRTLDWSANGHFVVPPPRRRWRRSQFELVTRDRTGRAAPAFRTGSLEDHVVRGIPTVPAVHWVRRLLHQAHSAAAGMIADFVVHERADLSVLPEAVYRTDGAGVRAQAGATVLASARPAPGPTPADIVAWMRAVDANRAAQHRMRPLTAGSFYDALRRRGLEYGPRFRSLRALAAVPGSAIGHFDAAELHSAATLDGCLHLLAAADGPLPDGLVPLPIAMDTAWVSTEPGRVVAEAHAVIRERTARGLIGDIVGTDQHGVPVLAFGGVRVRFADAVSMDHGRLDEDFGGAERRVFRVETWQPIGRTGQGSGPSPTDAALRQNDPAGPASTSGTPPLSRALVVGESDLAVRLARALERTLPTERIAREPDAADAILASVLLAREAAERTALVLVWPGDESAAGTSAVARVLDLLQRAQSDPAIGSLTVLLPQRARHGSTANALAGLTRTLQLESGRPVRLVWTDTDPRTLPKLVELITEDTHPAELAVTEGELAVRRFVPATPDVPPIVIDPDGTYVVTGGLGALGAVAVRWLLDAGARDVVVLTRSPRPVPAVLDGSEDHVVVVGCDVADRSDLANALNDIRECGSTIRGVVHAAGALEDAAFEAVDADQLARMFAPKVGAAADLVALTATDPVDFVLLFSSATGAFGAPGQAAYAAANAAMDAVAAAAEDRRVLSIGWGVWATGLAATAGGAEHLRRAGINAIDVDRGTAMLGKALRYRGPYLLALGYTPTDDRSPVAARLRELLGEPSVYERSRTTTGAYATTARVSATTTGAYATTAGASAAALGASATATGASATTTGASAAALGSSATATGASATTAGASATAAGVSATAAGASAAALGSSANAVGASATGVGASTATVGASATGVGDTDNPIRRPGGAPAEPEPITAAIRRVLAATLDLPAETIGPTDDFNDLGLSSLLAIEVRRTLEARLRIAISTAELFQHPTIAALGAALADRVAANDSETS
ncbi:Ketoacyl-synthetase C-terminal extension [Nocardia amikacinitolerans]|uniref:type I polyketide synthase n=1 Tax=Nocardia amikacinitolerans TaxID=756689 RepID=UPI0020A38AF4|nr:type I polyketide synthase [Nocardia amikacinitolerans]MCP2320413.1 Ketoacyl-synthetase C-terminal extension [Nocardia amikacinitolerans]